MSKRSSLSSSARAAITKHHRLRQQAFVFSSSGGQTSASRWLQGWFLPRPRLVRGSQMHLLPVSSHGFPSVCVCVLLLSSSSDKNPKHFPPRRTSEGEKSEESEERVGASGGRCQPRVAGLSSHRFLGSTLWAQGELGRGVLGGSSPCHCVPPAGPCSAAPASCSWSSWRCPCS